MAGFGLPPNAPKYKVVLAKLGEPEEKDDKFSILIEGEVIGADGNPPDIGTEFEVKIEVLQNSTVAWTTTVDTVEGEFSAKAEGLENKKYKLRATASLEHGGKTYHYKSRPQDIDWSKKEGGGGKGATAIELKAVRLSNGSYHVHGTVVNDKGAGVKKSKVKIMSDVDGVLNAEMDAPLGYFSIDVTPQKDVVNYRFIALGSNADGTLRLLNANPEIRSKGWARASFVAFVLFVLSLVVSASGTLFTGNGQPNTDKPWYEDTTRFDKNNESDTGSTIPTWVRRSWGVTGALLFCSLFAIPMAVRGLPKFAYYKLSEKKNTDFKVPPSKSDDGKATKALGAVANSNDWVSWVTMITNLMDLFHERKR